MQMAYECLSCLDIAIENRYLKEEERIPEEACIDELIKMLVALQKTISRKSNI